MHLFLTKSICLLGDTYSCAIFATVSANKINITLQIMLQPTLNLFVKLILLMTGTMRDENLE